MPITSPRARLRIWSLPRATSHLAALLTVGCGGTSTAVTPPGGAEPSTRCQGLMAAPRQQTASVPQRGGGALEASLFLPDLAGRTDTCPMVVVLPGGGAPISSVEWAARRLATDGYVALIVRPAIGGSTDSYHQAAVSGIDFLQSASSPARAFTDTGRVGVAGWSLGARALTRTQAEDARVDALVAWDNLAVSESGDEGSPACTFIVGPVRAPRVPALGQASDTCRGDRSVDAKKAAYERWRAAGVPVMQVVFAGATHFLWSSSVGTEEGYALSHHYTRAWFDRWLRGDTGATTRLLARTINGRHAEQVLSTSFRSAAAFDGRSCGDLRSAC